MAGLLDAQASPAWEKFKQSKQDTQKQDGPEIEYEQPAEVQQTDEEVTLEALQESGIIPKMEHQETSSISEPDFSISKEEQKPPTEFKIFDDNEDKESEPELDTEQISLAIFGKVDNDVNKTFHTTVHDGTGESTASAKEKFSAIAKTDFKPKKLNKTIVLIILISVIAGVMIVVNLAFKKTIEPEKIEQKQSVEVGGDGDYNNYAVKTAEPTTTALEEGENSIVAKPSSSVYTYKEPPPYATTQPAVANTGGGGTKPPSSNPEYIAAMQSPLGKDVPGIGGRPMRGLDPNNIGSELNPTDERYRTVLSLSEGVTNAGVPLTKEQYMQQELQKVAAYSASMQQGSGATKTDSRYSAGGEYKAENTTGGKMVELTDSMLFPGTIIHGILVSGINTDYPGDIIARVLENVYDSKTGTKLLIPQGSILKGGYSSSSIGVAKIQIAWTDLIINYLGRAYMISLGGMTGIDAQGYSGIKGTLNDHWFEWAKAAGIMTLFTLINSEIAFSTATLPSAATQELIKQNQTVVNQVGNQMLARAMAIQPTVYVANGKRVSVNVNIPLTLYPFDKVTAGGPYVRP